MMKSTAMKLNRNRCGVWAAVAVLFGGVSGQANAQELTVLLPTPDVGALNDAQVEIHSSTNLTITYDHTVGEMFSGVWIKYMDGGRDFSAVTQFVFAAKGDPDVITVEFKDDQGGSSAFDAHQSPSLTNEFQIWTVPAADVTAEGVDLSTLEEIVFVIHDWSGGPLAGEVGIGIGGLPFTPSVDPSDPSLAPLTELPGSPALAEIAGTVFTQHSATNFTIDYDVTADPFFNAVIAQWDEATNLTAFSEFVFGVEGDPEAIAVEFEDDEGAKTVFHLTGVTNTLQHWQIDASDIENLDSIKGIVFVVSDTLAGTGNEVGECTVYVGGLDFTPEPIAVDPSSAGEAPLTILPDEPVVNDLDGTLFVQHSTTNFTVSYSLPGEDDWDGVMVRWTDFNPVDLSSVTQFVFGAFGTPDAIKVEFEDNDGKKTVFDFNGMTNTLQHWHIDAAEITGLDQIKVISFVVDPGLAGEGNEDGFYRVFVGGLAFEQAAATLDSSDPGLAPITILPDSPLVNDLVGTAFEQHSSTNFTVLYDLNVSTQDWEGVMVRWADFDPIDLTAIDTFVFGITGTPNSVKVEFVSPGGAVRTVFSLDGVTNTLRHWHIDGALIENLDDIEAIAFIVDPGLAGAGNEAGEFTVFVGGLDFDGEEPEEPVLDNFNVSASGGTPEASVNLGVGLDQHTYTLYYATDLMADPVVWTLATQVVGDGVAEVILTDDDEENSDALRIYRVGIMAP